MRTAIKIVLVLLIAGIGVVTCNVLSSMRQPPPRKEKTEQPTIVAATEAEPTAKPVVVTAMGSVVPARQVTVLPEVSGRIIYQHPEMVPGGRIAKGETLVRIDPRDYDLAIQAQQAQVSAAELNLAREESLKAVAEKEWDLIKDEVQPTEKGRKLALRDIQFKNAQVGLSSARSGLQKAELARQRTAIRAPFNAVVVEEYVDYGQVVGPASKLAVLADADTYWVRAAVPVDRLPWIQIPRVNADVGSQVQVVQQAGPEMQITREGRVIRLLPDLDPKGKMAQLLVQVDAPWAEGATAQLAHAVGSQPPAKGGLSPMSEDDPTAMPTPPGQVQAAVPLFLGSWVTVHIKGPKLEKVIQLPRLALRDRNKVWVKGPADKLQIRAVRVVWSKDDTVYVAGDLKPGEPVITSRISTPVQGMLVKTNGHDPDAPIPASDDAPQAPEAQKPDGSQGELTMVSRQDLYKGPISWMARNPVAANLLMIVLLVGGLMSAFSIKKEVFPEVEPDEVQIQVAYPGASPAEVEQGILLAIEEAVRPLDGVKEVESDAKEGTGSVEVELQRGADRQKALSDVKNAVDRITTFPEEAERPIVNLPEWKAEAIWLVVYGDQSNQVLHALGEQLRDEMLARPGISYIEVFGLPPLEMGVEIDADTLRRYGLTLPQIAQMVRRTALEVPAGGVKTKGGDWLLRTAERRDLAEEFATIPVVPGAEGEPVTLGQIAEITDGFAEVDIWAAFDGKPAIVAQVYSVGDESPTEVADAVKAYADDLRPRLPPGVHVATYMDRSRMYDDRMDLLMRNAAIGLVLVLVILGLFLEPRLAFWVTMGIPISFLGSLVLLPQFGVSINMLSLFAFIVTLGMVVDDAIVVGENTYRFRREGHSPIRAAILGAKQVATPVFFSIMTTVAAFSPLLFVPGNRGKWMYGIPVVVILVLLMSLIESFFILPAHLAHLRDKKKEDMGPIGRAQAAVSRAVERFVERIYLPVVRGAVRQRWISLALGVAVFSTAIGLVSGGHVKVIDFPREESDWVTAVARFPFGTAVAETEAAMDHMVRTARQVAKESGGEEITQGTFSMIGVSFGRHGGRGAGGHVTSVLVTLVPTDQRDISSHEFAKKWREAIGDIPGLEALSFDSSTGGSTKPIDMKITHRDIPTLEAAAQDLADRLATFDGLKDIDNGIELGKPQLDFTMTAAGTKAGLTPADLAAQVRAAFYGAEALRQQRGRNEMKVLVRLPLAERQTLGSVEEMIIRTPAGGEMPLREAAHVEYGRAYTSITRVDGKRIIRVQADIDEAVANQQEVMGAIFSGVMPKLMQKHPGLAFAEAGRQKDMKDFFSYLFWGFLVALMVMYGLIAVPLKSFAQPFFVVMLPAIAFGFVGALLGHLLMGMALSMISFMGIVALSGVVVNDSLVLVAAANRFRDDDKLPPVKAAVAAARQRFRPVILTSLTTFGGLAPMIFETSVQARILIPMAVALGFGVLFSTLIVLVLMPAVFVIIENGRANMRRAWRWLFPLSSDAEPPEDDSSEPGELGSGEPQPDGGAS